MTADGEGFPSACRGMFDPARGCAACTRNGLSVHGAAGYCHAVSGRHRINAGAESSCMSGPRYVFVAEELVLLAASALPPDHHSSLARQAPAPGCRQSEHNLVTSGIVGNSGSTIPARAVRARGAACLLRIPAGPHRPRVPTRARRPGATRAAEENGSKQFGRTSSGTGAVPQRLRPCSTRERIAATPAGGDSASCS